MRRLGRDRRRPRPPARPGTSSTSVSSRSLPGGMSTSSTSSVPHAHVGQELAQHAGDKSAPRQTKRLVARLAWPGGRAKSPPAAGRSTSRARRSAATLMLHLALADDQRRRPGHRACARPSGRGGGQRSAPRGGRPVKEPLPAQRSPGSSRHRPCRSPPPPRARTDASRATPRSRCDVTCPSRSERSVSVIWL